MTHVLLKKLFPSIAHSLVEYSVVIPLDLHVGHMSYWKWLFMVAKF